MIEIKNINRVLNKKFGLYDVSFEIPTNAIVAFVGDNGAGKTTTIKAIFNELRISSGTITVNGENLFSKNNLNEISFFPDSNNIPLNMSLSDYIFYICSVNGMKKNDIDDRTEKVYNLLGLKPHKDKKLKQLSAGWKKRAIMASVLVRGPKYIILDEPTANLDIGSKLEFISILKELNKLGVTIMITSHIIEELQEIATHLVFIQKGKIMYNAPFNNKEEKIIDVYSRFTKGINLDVNTIKDLFVEKE